MLIQSTLDYLIKPIAYLFMGFAGVIAVVGFVGAIVLFVFVLFAFSLDAISVGSNWDGSA